MHLKAFQYLSQQLEKRMTVDTWGRTIVGVSRKSLFSSMFTNTYICALTSFQSIPLIINKMISNFFKRCSILANLLVPIAILPRYNYVFSWKVASFMRTDLFRFIITLPDLYCFKGINILTLNLFKNDIKTIWFINKNYI